MSTVPTTATVLAVILATSATARAQGQLTDVHSLPHAERIVVTDRPRATNEGTLATLDATGTRMVDRIERELAASDGSEISQRRDSLKNGAIIGALVGGALGAVGGYYLAMLFENEARSGVGPFLYTIGIGAAGGAAIGAGIDAALYRNDERSVRVTPVVTPGTRAANVSITF